jgi:hypothetical protein
VTSGGTKREGLSTFEKCLERPINEKSVLEWLSMRRFADIQEQTSTIVFSRKEIFWRNSDEEKEIKSRVSSARRR